MIKILGIDPAVKEAGYCLLSMDETYYELHKVGLLKYTIKDLGDKLTDKHKKSCGTLPNFNLFYQELKDMISRNKPDLIVVERFSLRAHKAPKELAEKVNLMNGIISAIATKKKIPIVLINPSVWKRQFGNSKGVSALHKKGKEMVRREGKDLLPAKEISRICKMFPHTFDAAMISLFAGSAKVGIDRLEFTSKVGELQVKIAKNLK